ncbi:hypothetical protein DL93DRAFT_2225456 [Clavulina sp. PMI_390]|nr:hypothetical protein DL93DRAFT_2225456 [Clavulina sp. PMI_390]
MENHQNARSSLALRDNVKETPLDGNHFAMTASLPTSLIYPAHLAVRSWEAGSPRDPSALSPHGPFGGAYDPFHADFSAVDYAPIHNSPARTAPDQPIVPFAINSISHSRTVSLGIYPMEHVVSANDSTTASRSERLPDPYETTAEYGATSLAYSAAIPYDALHDRASESTHKAPDHSIDSRDASFVQESFTEATYPSFLKPSPLISSFDFLPLTSSGSSIFPAPTDVSPFSDHLVIPVGVGSTKATQDILKSVSWGPNQTSRPSSEMSSTINAHHAGRVTRNGLVGRIKTLNGCWNCREAKKVSSLHTSQF